MGEWVILDLFALAAATYLPANVLQEMEDQQRKFGKQIVQNAIRRCQQEKVLLLPCHPPHTCNSKGERGAATEMGDQFTLCLWATSR